MNRRAFLATGAAAVAAGLSGCPDGSRGATTGDDHDVGMTTRRFRPDTVTVEPGTTVVWKNTSSHAHTVTAYEGQIPEDAEYWASGDFDSEQAAREGWRADNGGAIFEDGFYRHTFEVVGEHDYVCIPHEQGGMLGTVVVEENTE